jgi:hypothetical protein
MVLRGKGTGNYETKPRSVFFSSLPESSHAKGWPQHRIIAGCGLRRVGSLMFGLALTLGRDLGLLSHEFGKSVDRLLTGEEKN